MKRLQSGGSEKLPTSRKESEDSLELNFMTKKTN